MNAKGGKIVEKKKHTKQKTKKKYINKNIRKGFERRESK